MRVDGWESRLCKVIADARAKPYVLGEHDCFRVACAVIEALTGVDRWPEFKGYTTKREALRRIAAVGASFMESGDHFFGAANRYDPYLAQRGDIAAVRDLQGQYHLGVVMGRDILCTTDAGMVALGLGAAQCVWRVR